MHAWASNMKNIDHINKSSEQQTTIVASNYQHIA